MHFDWDIKAKPPRGVSPYPFNPGGLDNGIELDLLMNEGAGGSVLDYGPNKLDQVYLSGALTPDANPCPRWAQGTDGPCLDFGAGAAQELNYIRKGINKFPTDDVALTIMAYCFPTNNNVAIMSMGFRTNGDASQDLAFGIFSGPLSLEGASGPTVTLNKWQWLCVSQTAGNARTFWIDKTPTANATASSGTAIGADQPFCVGANYLSGTPDTEDSTQRYQGKYGRLLVWSRGLAAEEIRAVQADPYWRYRWPRARHGVKVPSGGTTLFRRTLYNRTGSRGVAA